MLLSFLVGVQRCKPIGSPSLPCATPFPLPPPSQEVVFLDSLSGGNPAVVDALRRYASDESKDKVGRALDTSGWRGLSPRVRLQRNGLDCGVFTCLFANRVAAGRGFDFRQEHVLRDARVRIVNELLAGALFD